jgi:YD repeat-containing protein
MTRREESGSVYEQGFDAENRLVSVTVGGQTTRFVYDGDGARVKKIEGGVTTVYVGGYYEVQSSTGGITRTSYYYAGGQRVAMRQGPAGAAGALTYLHVDHLGSTSLATGAGSTLGDTRLGTSVPSSGDVCP